jgi:uncharacterized membrane protein
MDGDNINSLPINDNEKLPEHDEQLLDLLLEDKKQQVKDVKKVSMVFKESILAGLLFLVLSHPLFDKLIRKCGCTSEVTVLLMKFVFLLLFFLFYKINFF